MYVYVLDGVNGLYIGHTQDLTARVKSHAAGKCATSAKIGAFEVAGWWNVATRYDAHKLEIYLQRTHRAKGADYIMQLLREFPAGPGILLTCAKEVPDSEYQLKLKAEANG